MADQIPSFEDVHKRLKALSHAQMQALARGSEVSYFTLLKIRNATTENPGIETVRKFWIYIEAVERGWDGVEKRGKARA